jgi:glycosyltransferase involved in cell wall biosynthesis
MTASPKVVLGMPAYKRPDTLPRTLESLLSQTYRDFALLIVDDAASPEVATLVERYAREYPLVSYEGNAARLGMVGNWRKVFERARQRYPRSGYFAWVSDHDVWHARWLQEMVSVLDQDRDVVLVYPENLRMLPDGAKMAGKGFQTVGMQGRADRIRQSARHLLAGDMIYGLIRADALEAAGVFRSVLTPDRQVLLALSLFGQFKQVPEVLWYREMVHLFGLPRQREALFATRPPLYVYLPANVQLFALLLWDFGIRAKGRPAFGRLAGIYYAGLQLWFALARDLTRPKSGWRRALTRVFARWQSSASPTAGDVGPRAQVE